jgi:hypothetical protein
MSISRLSAGAGYRYLTRHTAAGDARPGPGQSLTAYYTATGLPPGRWTGAGLPGLGASDGTGLRPGAVVTEEAMGRLFGTGHDPVTGERLGLAYPRFKTTTERIAERVGRLPADLPDLERPDLHRPEVGVGVVGARRPRARPRGGAGASRRRRCGA